MEKKNSSEGMSKFMLLLLMSTGADIVAPKPVKNHILKALGVKSNDGFELANSALSSVDTDKADLIKGLIISNLTPSQMMGLHEFIKGCVTTILEYCKDHPEERKEIDAEEAMKRLGIFEEDDDDEDDD